MKNKKHGKLNCNEIDQQQTEILESNLKLKIENSRLRENISRCNPKCTYPRLKPKYLR